MHTWSLRRNYSVRILCVFRCFTDILKDTSRKQTNMFCKLCKKFKQILFKEMIISKCISRFLAVTGVRLLPNTSWLHVMKAWWIVEIALIISIIDNLSRNVYWYKEQSRNTRTPLYICSLDSTFLVSASTCFYSCCFQQFHIHCYGYTWSTSYQFYYTFDTNYM